jgi:hypothetical protein
LRFFTAYSFSLDNATREEAVKQAIAIAYRANGFAEKLHREGNTRRGDIVRETRERILSLETEQYPACVLVSILETAEVLKRMLDKANFDSRERKYMPPRKSI